VGEGRLGIREGGRVKKGWAGVNKGEKKRNRDKGGGGEQKLPGFGSDNVYGQEGGCNKGGEGGKSGG